MNSEDFRKRTAQLALRVIRLCDALPKSRSSDTIARQLLRCGTSVGANYRAACVGKSRADFVAKMKIVEEECDETIYWLELLVQAEIVKRKRLDALLQEARELLAMVTASIRTARRSSGARS